MDASSRPIADRLRAALEKVQGETGANGIDEILYAWLLTHPARIMPIVGSGKKERIQSAINSLNITRGRFAIRSSADRLPPSPLEEDAV